MTPCSTGWENHDWYIKYNLAAGDKIKFKDNTSSWDYNRGGTFINREDGMYGYGTQGGADLVIDEGGEYLIFFNDITGYYRFIKQ